MFLIIPKNFSAVKLFYKKFRIWKKEKMKTSSPKQW